MSVLLEGVWSSEELVLCAPGAVLLAPVLPALMQQPTYPIVPHHIQPEAILRRNLQRPLCPIWGK